MAQFDVFINPNPVTKRAIPYLLDIQTDLLNNLTTRVVIPLYTVAAMGKAAKFLNLQFSVKRTTVIMSTAEMAGVAVNSLGVKVCSLREHRNEIIAAIDFLVTGF
ncbi:MAG: plasmid maintenance protein CcdB [Desulfuromonadaceae bacterium GWB2_53_15]|nr:MAG: plasmid maintenance protein CcdB [Desulfuromonadaceae bacterium GWB2_53_15]